MITSITGLFLLHRSPPPHHFFFPCHFCHLKPETKSESLHQQKWHPSSQGRRWGKSFSGAESFLVLLRLLLGQDQPTPGAQGPQGAALPSWGQAPPCRFSRSLGLPIRSEPEAVGAREAFFQHSSARACEPGLAAGRDSFSARSPSYPGKAGHHLQHGRGLKRDRGKPDSAARGPASPNSARTLRHRRAPWQEAHPLPQQRCPPRAAPHPAAGASCSSAARSSEPRADPLPAARGWARGSRRGWGLEGRAQGSRRGRGAAAGWD